MWKGSGVEVGRERWWRWRTAAGKREESLSDAQIVLVVSNDAFNLLLAVENVVDPLNGLGVDAINKRLRYLRGCRCRCRCCSEIWCVGVVCNVRIKPMPMMIFSL